MLFSFVVLDARSFWLVYIDGGSLDIYSILNEVCETGPPTLSISLPNALFVRVSNGSNNEETFVEPKLRPILRTPIYIWSTVGHNALFPVVDCEI